MASYLKNILFLSHVFDVEIFFKVKYLTNNLIKVELQKGNMGWEKLIDNITFIVTKLRIKQYMRYT